jgi:putative hydrolase of the HAD superfamily
MADRVSHVLLDFFGTLVDYSPGRAEQGYHRSHALLQSMGEDLSYEQFLREWSAESSRLERRSDADDSEFSMAELATALLSRLLGRPPESCEVAALVDTYLAEWNTCVTYPAAMQQTVGLLASRFRLAIVTNTQDSVLVPNHLAAMGIADQFDAVVTSVELGWRKPHPAVYAEALRRLGITASNAIFVGDTFAPDYASPRLAGMSAFLIDPDERAEVPDDQRLRSLAELPEKLGLAPRSHGADGD